MVCKQLGDHLFCLFQYFNTTAGGATPYADFCPIFKVRIAQTQETIGPVQPWTLNWWRLLYTLYIYTLYPVWGAPIERSVALTLRPFLFLLKPRVSLGMDIEASHQTSTISKPRWWTPIRAKQLSVALPSLFVWWLGRQSLVAIIGLHVPMDMDQFYWPDQVDVKSSDYCHLSQFLA